MYYNVRLVRMHGKFPMCGSFGFGRLRLQLWHVRHSSLRRIWWRLLRRCTVYDGQVL